VKTIFVYLTFFYFGGILVALRYSIPYTISLKDTDNTKEMTLPALLRIAIDCSEEQCRLLNRDENYVRSLGITWIIVQHEIHLARLPIVNEEVVIATEASFYNRYFCYRNFWYFDSNGYELVHIHTTFALMDQLTRRLHPISKEIIEPFHSDKVEKIYRAPSIGKLDLKNIIQQEYQVRSTDIDGNGHVNNSVYLGWLIAPLDQKFLHSHLLKFVNLRYIKEILKGSLVKSLFSLSEDVEKQKKTHHLIDVDGVVHAEAEMTWDSLGNE
jgi:medium-chain acyl-[acyl-carrier-protein] hydrolase